MVWTQEQLSARRSFAQRLTIEVHHDTNHIEDIDTPRRSRRRADAATIRRRLNRVSPSMIPNLDASSGIGSTRLESHKDNVGGLVGPQVGKLTKGSIMTLTERNSRHCPLGAVDNKSMPQASISPGSSCPRSDNQSFPNKVLKESSTFEKDHLTTTSCPPKGFSLTYDDQILSLCEQKSKPPDPGASQIPPDLLLHTSQVLPSEDVPSLDSELRMSDERMSDETTKKEGDEALINKVTKKITDPIMSKSSIPTELAVSRCLVSETKEDVALKEIHIELPKGDSHPTLSTMTSETGHDSYGKVSNQLTPTLKMHNKTTLMRTDSSITGASVDAESLVAEFISEKSNDDDPEVSVDDFTSIGSSHDSILMSNSIKDARKSLALDGNLVSNGEFDLNIRQIHMNDSCLSNSSRADVVAVDNPYDGNSITASESPSPPRPKTRLKKEFNVHKSTKEAPPIARRRFRRIHDNGIRRSSCNLALSRNIKTASTGDLPPLATVVSKSATEIRTAAHTDPSAPRVQEDCEKTPLDTEKRMEEEEIKSPDETSTPAQKVYSFYSPEKLSSLTEKRNQQKVVESPEVSASHESAHSPQLISSPPSDVELHHTRSSNPILVKSEDTDVIPQVLDEAIPVPVISDDDRSTSTVMRSDNQTNVDLILPFEDIDCSDSSSADDVDLELDSFRIFEVQCNAQSPLAQETQPSLPCSNIVLATNTGDIVPAHTKDMALVATSDNQQLQTTHANSVSLVNESLDELALLRKSVAKLDAEVVRQRAVVRMQKLHIDRLKEERDLLKVELEASSNPFPRYAWEEHALVSCCVGKASVWSGQFNSAFKCG